MKLLLQKMQNFRALGALPPNAQQLGASPPDPHWPPAAGGSAPRPPKQPPPHCEFLATRLVVLCDFARKELARLRSNEFGSSLRFMQSIRAYFGLITSKKN